MTALEDFSDDPKWIQEQINFPVLISEIKTSLVFLNKIGMISEDAEGEYKKPDKEISCMSQVFSNALIQFHRNFLKLAADSTLYAKTDERQLLGHCISLDKESTIEANKIITEAYEKIRKLKKNTNEEEAVYFVELALFPLTKGSTHE